MMNLTLACQRRIQQITWLIEWPSKPSQDTLFQEYLRRSALWAEQVGGEHNWPFWNIAVHIAHPVSTVTTEASFTREYLENIRLTNESVEILRDFTGSTVLPNIVKQTCVWYIEWCLLRQESKRVDITSLPDPFEPLIHFYERGGVVTSLSKEWIRTVRSSFRNDVRYWATHIPAYPNLDETVLEAIDAQYGND